MGSVAWDLDTTGGRSRPVGGKSPNALGLYDMSGNVWEWVEDVFAPDVYSRPARPLDLVVEAGSRSRVLCGGSFANYPRDLRAAIHFRSSPDNRFSSYGFRVVFTGQP